MFKTLIIIPTYNEADNIASLIQAIFALDLGVDILVVDDNSPDGTGARVLELQNNYLSLHLLARGRKAGLGQAYLAGFAWANTQGYEAVVQMDADFSHSPKHLETILQALANHDFVIGSRYVKGGGVVNWPILRQIISRGGGLYARLILGLNIKDLTGGFNAWRLVTLEKINLATIRSNGYGFQIELKAKAVYAGCAYLEVPIIFEERRLGQSKLKGQIITEAVWRVWKIKWQNLDKKIMIALLALLILTALVYQPIFKSEFLITWDDNLQVTQNSDIATLTFDNLKNIFSSFYVGMYQPLTTLGYSLEYYFFGLNPAIFHGTNLLLHLINILLVYCLVKNILKKYWPALAVTAVFALHPMQVEAVAWVSAKSTLLCSTFLLLGTLAYWRYTAKQQRSDLWKTLVIFLLALFTKALAIIFPLILMMVDWYHKKLNKKTLLEKIPFLIISALFTWLALVSRKRAEHLLDLGSYYSLFDKLTFVLSSLLFYITKLFWPLNLSPYYNYPPKINNLLPTNFYLAAGLAVVLIAVTIWALRRFKHQPGGRLLALAGAWWLINLVLVLKIIPVGFQYAADRYNYLAMLGPLLILFYAMDKLAAKHLKIKIILIICLLTIITGLSLISRQTTASWHDDLTLINKAISRAYPDTNLYLARGLAKYNPKDYQGALDDFNYSLNLNDKNLTAHYNRALLLSESFQRHQEALADLNFVIASQSTPSAYYERGKIKVLLGDFPGALADYAEASKLRDDWLYSFTRANLNGQLKKYPEALADYRHTLELVPNFALAYYYKGLTWLNMGRPAEACQDWQSGTKVGLKLDASLEKLCSNQ